MISAFRTSQDYERYLYELTDLFPSIRHTSITFVRRGASLARISGELFFESDIRLIIRERVTYNRLPVVIDGYGYEVWQGEEKLYWYDSQPHPNEPHLQVTHPHHKHVPPDIKHNRIPAPNLSFTQPNLPLLIKEIEDMINGEESVSPM